MLVKKQQLESVTEEVTGSKLGKEYDKAIFYHCAYLTTSQLKQFNIYLGLVRYLLMVLF